MATSVGLQSNPYYIQDYSNLNKQVDNVSSNPIYNSSKQDEFEIKDKTSKEYSCTDGSDDGKLSWKEAGKCIFDGVKKNIKERIDDAKNGIIKKFKDDPVKTTLITVGIGIATAAIMLSPIAPVALAILSCVGFVIALKQGIEALNGVADSVKDAKNATTDKEAKEAFCNIGDNGVDLVESAVEIYASTKAVTSSFEALDNAADTAKHMDDLKRIADGSADIDDVKRISDEAKDVKEGLENVIDNKELLEDTIKEGLTENKKFNMSNAILGIALPVYNKTTELMKKEEE